MKLCSVRRCNNAGSQGVAHLGWLVWVEWMKVVLVRRHEPRSPTRMHALVIIKTHVRPRAFEEANNAPNGLRTRISKRRRHLIYFYTQTIGPHIHMHRDFICVWCALAMWCLRAVLCRATRVQKWAGDAQRETEDDTRPTPFYCFVCAL